MLTKKLLYGAVPGHNVNTWVTSLENEVGRLADGVGEMILEGTKIIKFIPQAAIPQCSKVTYDNTVCDIRPQKAEVHRV